MSDSYECFKETCYISHSSRMLLSIVRSQTGDLTMVALGGLRPAIFQPIASTETNKEKKARRCCWHGNTRLPCTLHKNSLSFKTSCVHVCVCVCVYARKKVVLELRL